MNIRKCSWIFVLLLLVISLYSPVRAAAPIEKPVVTGLISRQNPSAEEDLVNQIEVTISGATSLYLQYRDARTQNWVTAKTYSLAGSGQPEKVELVFPDFWKQRTDTTWRILIPETEGSKAYQAWILVTAMNRGDPELDSTYAAIVRGSDGALLYGKNEHAETPNASTTKMMTALLTFENTENLDIATVSARAAATPWGVMFLYEGERLYIKDLLDALLVRSCNEAAAVLAEHVAGSQETFVEMMNQKAEELGLENTHYVNPHGLYADGHYSSAYDLCRLQQVCFRNPQYRKTLMKRQCSFYDVDHTKGFYYASTDLLLQEQDLIDAGFCGGKTGYIEEAGQCFAGVFMYQGDTYYFASLGASTKASRWEDAKALIQYIQDYAS